MAAVRRNAALFIGISVVSGFGSTSMWLVAGVWILDLTGSASLAGLAGWFIYAPTLAAPVLGGLVDRLPRRALAIGVDLVLAVVVASLLVVRTREQVWLIFAVMLAYGMGHVVSGAAENALLPAALDRGALGDVNGWQSSAREGMKLVAPLAGVAIYTWRGGGAAAVVSAVMPVLAALLYAAVRLERPPVASPPAGRLRVRSWVRKPAVLRPVLVAGVAIAMSGFTTAAVYARVTDGLDLPATFIGVLAAGQGAGSILGGLVAGRLIAWRGPLTAAGLGAVVFALGLSLYLLPWWQSMVVGGFTIGLGLPWTLVSAMTAVQLSTPEHLLGRVSATASTLMFGPIALTNPLGAAAVHLGAPVVLVVAIVVSAGTGLLALRQISSARHEILQ